MKVLIVEDDPDIASLLKRNFQAEGVEPTHAESGEAALDIVQQHDFGVILLDVMLPGCSGLDLCRRLRLQNNDATIIMLSARDTVNDRIDGLSSGADDYMVKPFSFEELHARIIAQQRHRLTGDEGSDPKLITCGRLSYNPKIREVSLDERRTELTEREADLLLYLLRHAGQPKSREAIFDALWQSQGGVSINVVDVYVGYLRRKLGTLSPEARASVRTVRGKGFMFTKP